MNKRKTGLGLVAVLGATALIVFIQPVVGQAMNVHNTITKDLQEFDTKKSLDMIKKVIVTEVDLPTFDELNPFKMG